MLRRAAALALLALSSAVACGGYEPREADVWLPEGHPLAAAQAAWGMPLWAPVAVVELPRDAMGEACGAPDKTPFGCVLSMEAIAVADDLNDNRRAEVLTHELGHILGGGGHLDLPDCPTRGPGAHVMCEGGAPEPTLTPEDFDFVLGTAPRR